MNTKYIDLQYFDNEYGKFKGFRQCSICKKYPTTIFYRWAWHKFSRYFYCSNCYKN